MIRICVGMCGLILCVACQATDPLDDTPYFADEEPSVAYCTGVEPTFDQLVAAGCTPSDKVAVEPLYGDTVWPSPDGRYTYAFSGLFQFGDNLEKNNYGGPIAPDSDDLTGVSVWRSIPFDPYGNFTSPRRCGETLTPRPCLMSLSFGFESIPNSDFGNYIVEFTNGYHEGLVLDPLWFPPTTAGVRVEGFKSGGYPECDYDYPEDCAVRDGQISCEYFVPQARLTFRFEAPAKDWFGIVRVQGDLELSDRRGESSFHKIDTCTWYALGPDAECDTRGGVLCPKVKPPQFRELTEAEMTACRTRFQTSPDRTLCK